MHFTKRGALPTILLLLLVACAGPKPATPEYVAVKEVEQQKAAVSTVTQSIAKALAWFLQPPLDANALHAAATESSHDMLLLRYPVGENDRWLSTRSRKARC